MSDPTPTPAETPPEPNLETVTLQGTYRIGFSPPAEGSLAAGEIYVQVPVDGGAPVLFVGGLAATVVQMVPPLAGGAARAKAEEHGPPAPPKDRK
jgi:hypothetical protein